MKRMELKVVVLSNILPKCGIVDLHDFWLFFFIFLPSGGVTSLSLIKRIQLPFKGLDLSMLIFQILV